MLFVYAPLQLLLAIVFLYQILSWSSLIGMLVLVITLPIPGMLAKLMNSIQGKLMAASTERIGEISEAVGAVRMLKMFAWETKSAERIHEQREKELKLSRQKQIISQVCRFPLTSSLEPELTPHHTLQLTDSANFLLPVATTCTVY
jgi:ABC-type bacteriocin/lantibiotic exporter with double-glycine peptidase domain